MSILLGFAILTGFVWFFSRTVSDWFLNAFEGGPPKASEKSRPGNAEVLYPTRRWAEARRV